jgi:hypothetical protein
MQGASPPSCGLETRLTTLLRKKNIVAKSKEVKTGWSANPTELTREGYDKKERCYTNDEDYDHDDDDDNKELYHITYTSWHRDLLCSISVLPVLSNICYSMHGLLNLFPRLFCTSK